VSYFMTDVEADGPVPGVGDYSMVMLGCVLVRPEGDPSSLVKAPTFYGEFCPISPRYDPEALRVAGVTRAQTLAFEDPAETVGKFVEWVEASTVGRPSFISDNNGFDFSFASWYCHHFVGRNPFGHSSTNLGSLYKGIVRTVFENFKHLRVTRHTHHPVDDAMGNAEALVHMRDVLGLRINLE
jgi:hypothetical protein